MPSTKNRLKAYLNNLKRTKNMRSSASRPLRSEAQSLIQSSQKDSSSETAWVLFKNGNLDRFKNDLWYSCSYISSSNSLQNLLRLVWDIPTRVIQQYILSFFWKLFGDVGVPPRKLSRLRSEPQNDLNITEEEDMKIKDMKPVLFHIETETHFCAKKSIIDWCLFLYIFNSYWKAQ